MTLIRNILAKQHQCRSAATTADFAGDPFQFQRWAHLTEMYQKFDLTNPEMLRDSPTSAHLTTTTAQELCFLPHTSTGDEIPTHYPVQQDHAMTGTTGDSPRFETPTCLHRHKSDINLESHTRINPQAPMVNSNHTDHRRPTPHDIMLSWGSPVSHPRPGRFSGRCTVLRPSNAPRAIQWGPSPMTHQELPNEINNE